MLIDPYEFHPVTISQIVREAPLAVSVRLSVPTSYAFQAGQYAIVRVTLPGGIRLVRQYSFSSAPNSGEIWLTVTETPGGAVSSWFNQTARVGDTLELSKPFNGRLVQKATRGGICMIAGGSGIAPLMSHLRELRTEPSPPTVHLLYSTRLSNRCFEQELAPAPHEIIYVHSSDSLGRVTQTEVTKALIGCETVYICGSHQFVQHVETLCRRLRPEIVVFSESFTL